MNFLALLLVLFASVGSQNVLIVGDSQACAMKFGAVGAVKAQSEHVDIVCKGGTRTAYWNGEKMSSALSKSNYDAVIVFLGSNDYGSKPDPRGVVQKIKDANVKACVWVGPPLIRGQKSSTNEHLKSLVSSPCVYLDSQALGVPLADGVHPTPSGAIKWLKRAWEIKNSLLSRSGP